MTTIAFKNGTMASDSQMTGDFIDQKKFDKVYRFGDVLVGVAGNVTWIMEFLEWLQCDDDTPYPVGMGYALVYSEGELKCFEGDSHQAFVVGQPYAIGSGSQFAMGAMLSGASARKAITIACKLDELSGGEVQHRTISTRKRKRKS